MKMHDVTVYTRKKAYPYSVFKHVSGKEIDSRLYWARASPLGDDVRQFLCLKKDLRIYFPRGLIRTRR